MENENAFLQKLDKIGTLDTSGLSQSVSGRSVCSGSIRCDRIPYIPVGVTD